MIRRLGSGEEDELLQLLAHWPFADGQSGSTFFARYLDRDPTYRSQNVLVAEDRGTLVSCAQIFPRQIRIAGESVPCGGIGTVFTLPSHRNRGLASDLLKEARQEMTGRGMEISLLFASRVSWYQSLGWRPWGAAPRRLSIMGSRADHPLEGPNLAIAQFDPDRHFDAVRALGDHYSADRHGTVIRSEAGWRVSLELAGNPVEEFLVAQGEGLDQIIVYLRGCILGGAWQVLEWACAEGHEEHLAELIAATSRAVGQEGVLAPSLHDELLEDSLLARGIRQGSAPSGSPVWMASCLDPTALARRFGLPEAMADDPFEALAVVLPPPAFHFWTADRF